MVEIPRYRMTYNLGELDKINGSWIKYEDYSVAVNAAVIAERYRCLDILEKIQGCPPAAKVAIWFKILVVK